MNVGVTRFNPRQLSSIFRGRWARELGAPTLWPLGEETEGPVTAGMSRRGLAEVSSCVSDVRRAGPGLGHSVTSLSRGDGRFGPSPAVSQAVCLLPERRLIPNKWRDSRDPLRRR